jgi:hypothetical protein
MVSLVSPIASSACDLNLIGQLASARTTRTHYPTLQQPALLSQRFQMDDNGLIAAAALH